MRQKTQSDFISVFFCCAVCASLRPPGPPYDQPVYRQHPLWALLCGADADPWSQTPQPRRARVLEIDHRLAGGIDIHISLNSGTCLTKIISLIYYFCGGFCVIVSRIRWPWRVQSGTGLWVSRIQGVQYHPDQLHSKVMTQGLPLSGATSKCWLSYLEVLVCIAAGRESSGLLW